MKFAVEQISSRRILIGWTSFKFKKPNMVFPEENFLVFYIKKNAPQAAIQRTPVETTKLKNINQVIKTVEYTEKEMVMDFARYPFRNEMFLPPYDVIFKYRELTYHFFEKNKGLWLNMIYTSGPIKKEIYDKEIITPFYFRLLKQHLQNSFEKFHQGLKP